MRLDDATPAGSGRNLIVTSSCGLCGIRNIDRLMSGQLASRDSLRVPASLLVAVADRMQARQRLFARTGATHAAAIFTADGELLAFGEDIGRHNALDKAIGECLLQGLSLGSRGVMLSGRVSLELVAKAANAGIEIVAAVSAPSSLAIDVAQRGNITLCSFVRGNRATVYTRPHRIEELSG
jgi:FdhD protein